MASVHNENTALLVQALLSLKDEESCRNFLEDLLTTRELMDLSQRLMVATLLHEKLVYNEIAQRTGASSATISRVNRAYTYGAGGYAAVIPGLKQGNQCNGDMA